MALVYVLGWLDLRTSEGSEPARCRVDIEKQRCACEPWRKYSAVLLLMMMIGSK